MGSQDFIWRTSSAEHGRALARAHDERVRALATLLRAPFRGAVWAARAGWARIGRHARRRANRRALGELSDAQLKDIGVGRSEISYAAWALEFERDRAALRARHKAAETAADRTTRLSRLIPLRLVRPAAAAREPHRTAVVTCIENGFDREAS